MLSKMIVKQGTLMLRAVLIKLHSIHHSSTVGSSVKFIHSSSYGNHANQRPHWLWRNEYFRQIFCMRQPYRLFTTTKYSKKSEAKFRTKDKVPEDYELIYRGPLNSYIHLAQAVAAISSAVFIGVFAYKQLSGSLMIQFPFELEGKAGPMYGEIGSDSTENLLYVTAFVLFNALIYGLTMRYPLRIYCHKNADAYTCIMNGVLPSLTYKINYCSADVRRSKYLFGKIIPWRDSVFKIGSKTVLLMDNYFRTPADFSLMIREKENV